MSQAENYLHNYFEAVGSYWGVVCDAERRYLAGTLDDEMWAETLDAAEVFFEARDQAKRP